MIITINRNNSETQLPITTIDTKACYNPHAIRNAIILALEIDGWDKTTINEVFNQGEDLKCEPSK